MTVVTSIETFDTCFPTSQDLDGSDAMKKDPDYSVAYLRFHTDSEGLHGDSLVFTMGLGNDFQVNAIDVFAEKIVGRDTKEFFQSIGDVAREVAPTPIATGAYRAPLFPGSGAQIKDDTLVKYSIKTAVG